MATVWINAGEVSGDLQASALLNAIKEYQPDIKAYGMGGEYLKTAGQKNLFSIDELSVLGIAEIFTTIPRAIQILKKIKQELKILRPDVVILVDAPEFNFRIAKIAHELGLLVCYFIPPKVWAWRTSRIHFLKKYVDCIISILPFEPKFYRQFGIEVEYVGNPLTDLVNWPRIEPIQPVKGRIGIMPGSRKKEVERLLPEFSYAAEELYTKYPQLSFYCIKAPNISTSFLKSLWFSSIPLCIETSEDRYAAMRSCEYIIAASGTATLETALVGVPTVVTYKVSSLSALVARLALKVKWVSLPNLILGKEVFPELLQENVKGSRISFILDRWMKQQNITKELQKDLHEIRKQCGEIGSVSQAAQVVVQKFLSH